MQLTQNVRPLKEQGLKYENLNDMAEALIALINGVRAQISLIFAKSNNLHSFILLLE